MNKFAPQFNPKFPEQMKRYFGEIERQVYNAEIACANKGGTGFLCPCPGKCRFKMYEKGKVNDCTILKIRKIIGDHIEQHDASEEREEPERLK